MQQQIDLVVSGINKTPNLGQDVIYSGTVAAAAEACLHKIKACAISLVSNKKKPDFQHAAFFCKYLVLNIEKFFDLPSYTFLNINIPDFKGKKLAKDIAITTLGKRRYKEDIINEKSNTESNVYIYKFRSYGVINPNNEYQDGTDITAVYKEYKISITPLNLDFTDYEFIETFKKRL
jgi:5'-nucleotidase